MFKEYPPWFARLPQERRLLRGWILPHYRPDRDYRTPPGG